MILLYINRETFYFEHTPKINLCALIDKEMKSMDVGFADHSIVLTHRGDQQNPFSLVETRYCWASRGKSWRYHSASRALIFSQKCFL
jgi:hypothetical protein